MSLADMAKVSSSTMHLAIFDVEHGACAMLTSSNTDRIAMIDSGHNATTGWRPSSFIKNNLGKTHLDYLFITNPDQDHMSDLNGLWENEIDVNVLIRNRKVSAEDLRKIKEQQNELTDDIERYLDIHKRYTGKVSEPFDESMGGIEFTSFSNPYPTFIDTNNLSLVVFIKFMGFKILFPGDMEKQGWLKLLEDQSFRDELNNTTILVASHHGRENGFCEDIFDYFTPKAVVISDKPIVHSTQEMVPDYRNVTDAQGVYIKTTGKKRHVLTTRRDGNIIFTVNSDGSFTIDTELRG